MKVLLTGFDPFGGEKVNPSWEAVKLVEVEGVDIVKVELPTCFKRGAEKLEEEIKKNKADIVLCVGQAGGRNCITVERIAVNLMDARIEDNDGEKFADTPIRENGENAYFSNLPVKKMVESVRKEGIPCALSCSAGLYVCNTIMYTALYLGAKAGFVHVPFAYEQALDGSRAAMRVEDMAKAIEKMVLAAMSEEDLKVGMGETC